MAFTPSRVALAAITACVVAAAAGAGILLQPTRDRSEPAARGPNVSIDVVAPREPELEPGAVMDVGDLADGYTHPDYVQPGPIPARRSEVPESGPPAPEVEPRRGERLHVAAPAPPPRPVIVERREPPRRWPFGLDQPRPDEAAERRERRARLEAERRFAEQRRFEEARRFEQARRAERFDNRDRWPEPQDDRARDPYPERDGGGRQRQWYSSDGRPVAGPDGRY